MDGYPQGPSCHVATRTQESGSKNCERELHIGWHGMYLDVGLNRIAKIWIFDKKFKTERAIFESSFVRFKEYGKK